jgi:hypothetical protein
MAASDYVPMLFKKPLASRGASTESPRPNSGVLFFTFEKVQWFARYWNDVCPFEYDPRTSVHIKGAGLGVVSRGGG